MAERLSRIAITLSLAIPCQKQARDFLSPVSFYERVAGYLLSPPSKVKLNIFEILRDDNVKNTIINPQPGSISVDRA
jgi:hypothetical protein